MAIWLFYCTLCWEPVCVAFYFVYEMQLCAYDVKFKCEVSQGFKLVLIEVGVFWIVFGLETVRSDNSDEPVQNK